MTNATISAEQAITWGLANHLVPRDDIRAQALQIARVVATQHPGSIYQTKRLLRPSDLAERLEDERRHFVEQIKMRETQDSMIAFLDEMGL